MKKVVGFALHLARCQAKSAWDSQKGFLRSVYERVGLKTLTPMS